MARLETRSQLARLAGVSPSAITKACKGPLADACVGRRVDLEHPSVVAYLKSKGVVLTAPTETVGSKAKTPTQPRPRRQAKKASSAGSARSGKEEPAGTSAESIADGDEDPEHFLDMTLRELVDRFGTKTAFRDWLVARKTIADIREKDLKNDETEGRLISRELVRTHIFGAIDAVNRRLLGDSPKTIARRLYALAKDDAPVEDAEAAVRDMISSNLKKVAADAARVLRNA